MISAKYIRYCKQVIPFAVIWLLFGFAYVLLEAGLLGRSTVYISTGNQYSFKNSLVYISFGSLIMGTVQGAIEIMFLKNVFEKKALWFKILGKGIIYILLIILFLITVTIINRTVGFYDSTLSKDVLNDLIRFMNSFAFWSVVVYSGLVLLLALIISELGEYLGIDLLYNFFIGKYNKPNLEKRIFMFLDIKSSTTIAEQIGHEKYFSFIKSYYAGMTNAILETSGEVYQYVGDEIVITWPFKKGIENDNCIECFQKISNIIDERKKYYLNRFGVIPEFKAGYHLGEVTSGEIGVIKRDIVYSGDVLNTAARIQSLCNSYKSKILLSEDLVQELSPISKFKYSNIGKLTLRGKSEETNLYNCVFESKMEN